MSPEQESVEAYWVRVRPDAARSSTTRRISDQRVVTMTKGLWHEVQPEYVAEFRNSEAMFEVLDHPPGEDQETPAVVSGVSPREERPWRLDYRAAQDKVRELKEAGLVSEDVHLRSRHDQLVNEIEAALGAGEPDEGTSESAETEGDTE